MTDEFDPYYAWLGIPPEERPADYYRLLGVRQFESNRDAIGNALDQRMAHLRSMQTGPRRAHSQKLLNELAAAGACLLEPQKKRDYDERLRQRQLAPVTLVAAAPAIDVSPPRGPSRPGSARRQGARARSMPAGWVIAGAVAGLLCLTVAVIALLPPSGDRQRDPLAQGVAGGQPTPRGPYLQLPQSSAPPASTPDAALPAAEDAPPDVATGPADPLPASTDANPPAADQQPLPTQGPYAMRLRPGDGVELADTHALIDWTRPFTLEAVVRASGPSEQLVLGNCILGGHPQSPQGTTGWQLWLMPASADDQVRLALATGRGFWGQASRSATWRHLSAASDGATLRLFVDGRAASERPLTALRDHQLPALLNLTIGAHRHLHAQQPAGLEGEIRGLRISSACLYKANFAPPESLQLRPGTLLLLDFEHPLPGRIRDLSPQGHHGTLRGAQWVSLAESLGGDAVAAAADAARPSPVGTQDTATDAAGTADAATTDAATADPDLGAAEPMVVSDQQLTGAALPRPPVDQQLAAGVDSVRDVFQEDLAAAKTPQSMRRVAQELLALARQADQPADFRFALFCEAHRLLVESDDLTAALPVVDEMERHFRYQGGERRLSALKTFVERLETASQRRQFVDLALQVAARAASAEQFDHALEAARMAQGQAGRLADMELRRRAREGRTAVESARRRLQAAESARDKLRKTPDDSKLNSVWGRYLCFVRQDWPQGLPVLADCDDDALCLAARADLQAPAAAAAQAALADQWWSLAEALAEHERPAARDRACHWYRLAAPELGGVEKVRAVQRLESAGLRSTDASEVAVLFQRAMQQPPVPTPGVGPERAAMVGRLQVDGRDGGLLFHYENGVRFNDGSLRDVMRQAGAPAGALQLTLQGLFRLAEPATVVIRHRGGSLNGGQHSLSVDGRLQGEVGGGGAADAIYRLTLPRGDHTLQWTLAGGDFGACQLLLINAQGQPLTLFHTPPMAAAARRTPTRQTINMVRQ